MSQHTYFQAFPESCPLFQRLGRDRAFHVLHTQLTLLGRGPFYWPDLEPSEIEGTLDWLAEHEPAVASRAEAERLRGELRQEVEWTVAAHPGIERRVAYFEQVQEDVKEILVNQFQHQGFTAAAWLADRLLHGQEALAPELFGEGEFQWHLVPAGTVQKGAAVLLSVTPAVLEHTPGNWDLDTEDYEDYGRWRRLYLEAARRGEVIAVLNA